jgi:hypothetical protein
MVQVPASRGHVGRPVALLLVIVRVMRIVKAGCGLLLESWIVEVGVVGSRGPGAGRHEVKIGHYVVRWDGWEDEEAAMCPLCQIYREEERDHPSIGEVSC